MDSDLVFQNRNLSIHIPEGMVRWASWNLMKGGRCCPFPTQHVAGRDLGRGHACPLAGPQWARQEMPAFSQESLLRWDFPIYFINVRRPDTGRDKHVRLPVLISQAARGPQPGPWSSAQRAGPNSVCFSIRKKPHCPLQWALLSTPSTLERKPLLEASPFSYVGPAVHENFSAIWKKNGYAPSRLCMEWGRQVLATVTAQ